MTKGNTTADEVSDVEAGPLGNCNDRDGWIAATALLHNVPLITHNRRYFGNVTGLKVISEASS